MDGATLHVLSCTLFKESDTPSILRALRHGAPAEGENRTLLLFCDLAASSVKIRPHDLPMAKKLQSGVMAMNARRPGTFLLLVRNRAWDDAARMYLGEEQRSSCREIIARLLDGQQPEASFLLSTVSDENLASRYARVLFSPLSLAFTPDTPPRMEKTLLATGSDCMTARVLIANEYPRPVLSRLLSLGFSLSSLQSAKEDRLRRKGQAPLSAPTLYTAKALIASDGSTKGSAPLIEGCFFVQRSAALSSLFRAHRLCCLRGRNFADFLPLIQIPLLFLSALLGLPWLAALCVLLPEAWALLHPRLLPGALLRLALLPLTALTTLDALFCRLLAHSPLVRLRVPQSLLSPQGCALFGAALLPVALHGAQALVALLPVCLIWFAAPLIIPALHAPAIERIPLSEVERADLLSLCKSAYFDSQHTPASLAMQMLAACSGAMLGLLEPDEAARQAEKLLCALPDAPLSAIDHAALLASAQALRERMSSCDAASRDLPRRIELRALALELKLTEGTLCSLLAQARGEAAYVPGGMQTAHPLDLLFLPLPPARRSPRHALTLPLTHPHTYLLSHSPDTNQAYPASIELFLSLCASALDHPFYALLTRSPITGPYIPLLLI